MGSSGAGKTSLLNALSDRIKRNGGGNKLTGEVKINDSTPLTQNNFGSVASYVMQDDILFEWFTPKEALHFAITLKQTGFTEKEKDARKAILIIEATYIIAVRVGSLKLTLSVIKKISEFMSVLRTDTVWINNSYKYFYQDKLRKIMDYVIDDLTNKKIYISLDHIL